MIQPLMLLLSCINEEYSYDHPVDIMYLSRSDRQVIVQEAERLGRFVTDPSKIMMGEDVRGDAIVDDGQIIGGSKLVRISASTQMLLTRLQRCYEVFLNSRNSASNDEAIGDLGTDSIILRLEGNPKYVYMFVYSVMESKGLEYSAKIAKISDVYNAIAGHINFVSDDTKTQFLRHRLELQSTWQFWARMLTADIIAHTGEITQPLTRDDIITVAEEMRNLGFYGFVNPYKMYTDFLGSRINRKVDVNISDDVVNFFGKVVESGGASLS